jgi:hypothetical protein
MTRLGSLVLVLLLAGPAGLWFQLDREPALVAGVLE